MPDDYTLNHGIHEELKKNPHNHRVVDVVWSVGTKALDGMPSVARVPSVKRLSPWLEFG